MVTIDDALTYLGVDYADDAVTANVQRALNTAQKTLKGAIGADWETYLPDDPRADQLVLIYLDDLYSDRGVVSSKTSSTTRRLVADMELQLRMELRQAKEAAGV